MKKLLLFLTSAICLIGTIQSQTAGSFDNTFDGDGKRVITFGPGNDEFYDVEAQSDGKVVAVGASRVGTYYNFIIARFLPDGSYDPTFATVGYRQIVINTGDEFFYGVDVMDDGRIVAVGYTTISTYKKVVVYRFNANGTNDGTFGSGSGYVVTPISVQNCTAEDVTVQTDKKIVITGEANGGSNLDFFVARYLETGELDNTFNGNGFLVFDSGNYDNFGYGIEQHIDGSYVIAGQTATTSDFVIAKITQTGTLDNSFNSTGIYTNHISCNYNYGYDVVVQPDGKIIGAGYSQCGLNYLTMVRLTATGIADASFSGDGIVTYNLGSDHHIANDIKLQPDGKIVTCGYVLSGSYKFSVHRFLANGSIDASFGSSGSVITSILNEDQAQALAIYDKWVYVVGKSFNGTNYDMFINKLWLCSVPVITSNLSPSMHVCDGENVNITIAATGTGLSYQWYFEGSPVGINSSTLSLGAVNNTNAGVYYCEVINDCGVVTTSNMLLNVYPNPTVSVSITNTPCFGSCFGYAQAMPAGGTPTYIYGWNDPGSQSTQVATNLCPGSYNVTVTDMNGCSATSTGTVGQPADLIISTSSTSVSCNSMSDGTATVSVTGGTAGYTYLWSNGGTTQTITGLAAGTYGVTVTDALSCQKTSSVSVIEPPILTNFLTKTDPLCAGACNGTATANPSGGTAPYSYAWVSGGSLPTETGLCMGSASVTITDFNGCTTNSMISLINPPTLVATTTQTNILCYGDATGSATVNATGGTGTYTYSWLPGGQTTQTINSLTAGTYSYTVTDQNGCATAGNVTISQPPQINISLLSQTNVACFGLCNGSLSITVSGGVPSYSYLWTGGMTTQNLTGLCAGTYSVTVADANLCTTSATYTITEPAAITANAGGDMVVCANNSDVNLSGSVTVATGGIWTGGSGTYTPSNTALNAIYTPTASEISAGSITLTLVTTGNGSCTAANDVVNITITPAPTVTAGVDMGVCAGNSITLSGNVSGALGGIWTGGTGIFVPDNTALNATYIPSAGDISAGSVTLTLTTTGNGTCLAVSDNVTITLFPEVTGTITPTDVLCNGMSTGALDLTVNTGTPTYGFNWNTGASTEDLSGIPAGTYSVTITDSHSCSTTVSASVAESDVITISLGQSMVVCYGACDGTITTIVTGGSGSYYYIWNDGSSTSDLIGLCAGIYEVTVTDDYGCTAYSSTEITQPDELTATLTSSTDESYSGACDGTASASASGGVGPFLFSWSNFETTSDITGLCAGIYTVTVIDAVGCTAGTSATINNGPETVINGTVVYSTGVFNADDVTIELYYNNGISMMLMQTMNCGTAGIFEFSGMPDEGDYYLRAFVNDGFLYPNLAVSYYDSAFVWAEAIAIPVTYGSSSTVTFHMFEITPPASTGYGDISGTIYYLSGAKDFGEPVPGAEIYLEQEPEGEPIACDETDADGNYGFLDVEEGAYSLTVDIPGYPQVNTYDINVTPDDTTFTDLNFIVDTTAGGEYIDTTSQSVGITAVISDNFTIEVYPTLVENQLNVSCVLRKGANFAMYLRDVTGKEMINPVALKLGEGEYNYKLDEFVQPLTPGVYFLTVRIDNNLYLKKVVKK
ncbi:MAG: hypothetical protein A2W91_18680 [Bacteroidetes bacterium GWF2_38_335]|nr:MAG: hypothetical protein A2W91_18680 [Bacteroidetes bacterium GWF2_38_335]OFY78171.1 MAG: hypothetical protein A2281_04385 [Bacteroidetes bacterium RIFOXYA12_FULL_38_20]HBS88668.1 hypothetical protein [Bacteroidales bacterium]